MRIPDVLTLIGEDPKAHGVFDTPVEERRDVYVSVRSVGMNEVYQAMANGLKPAIAFRLADFADYHGEKIALFHGKQFRIIRTYQDGFGIDLTCEEITIDKAALDMQDEVDIAVTDYSWLEV